MSSNPFLYSGLIATYVPLTTAGGSFSNTFGFPDALSSGTIGMSDKPRQYSTYPHHAWLYPQESSSITLSVPWMLPTDYIEVGGRPYMGVLNLSSIMTLRSAGTAGTSACTISVVARFVDPQLAGPTTTVPQSGTVAGLAKDLEKIGFGVAAVQASMAAKVLKLVGMTNEASEAPVATVTNQIFPHLSSAEVSVPVDNFGLGPSRPADSSDVDYLDVATLAAIPSYLGVMSWTLSAPVNQQLGLLAVTPSHYHFSSQVGRTGTTYYDIMPSMSAYVASMFAMWSGTVCFKFKVLCSNFHRGKIRIWYDNLAIASTPAEGYIKSEILDLAESVEITIRVPMQSRNCWLYTDPILAGNGTGVPPTIKSLGTGAIAFERDQHNGTVRLEVCQKLSTLDALGNVQIAAWVWMEDAKFADPYCATNSGGPISLASPYNWQSGVAQIPSPPIIVQPIIQQPIQDESAEVVQQSGNADLGTTEITADLTGAITKPNLSYFEEEVTNLKELVHRATFYKTFSVPKSLTAASYAGARDFVTWRIPRMPRIFGQEFCTANNPICEQTSDGWNVNVVNTPLLQKVAALFYGRKGAVRWRFTSAMGQGAIRALSLSRSHYAPGVTLYTTTTDSMSAASTNAVLGMFESMGGRVTCNSNYPAVTVDVPDYNAVLFEPTNPCAFNDQNALNLTGFRYGEGGADTYWYDTMNLVATVYNSTGTLLNGDSARGDISVDAYVSAAPNFKFVHFRGVPYMGYTPNRNYPTISTSR
jgi:hypothetical protein